MVCAPPWRSISCPPVPPCGPSSAAQTMTVARQTHPERGDERSERPRRVQQRRQRGYPLGRFGEAKLGRWRTAGRLPLPESACVRGRNRAARSQGGTARFGRGLVDRSRAVRPAATSPHFSPGSWSARRCPADSKERRAARCGASGKRLDAACRPESAALRVAPRRSPAASRASTVFPDTLFDPLLADRTPGRDAGRDPGENCGLSPGPQTASAWPRSRNPSPLLPAHAGCATEESRVHTRAGA